MFDSRQLNCMIRDRTATITPTSRPCQGFLVALYRTYRYAYLWWPGIEVADETMVARTFSEAHWRSYGYIYLWLPGSNLRRKPCLPRTFSEALWRTYQHIYLWLPGSRQWNKP